MKRILPSLDCSLIPGVYDESGSYQWLQANAKIQMNCAYSAKEYFEVLF